MVTIYKLYCIHNGMAYIGCTAGKLGKRMREHRCLLNGNKHKARVMQALWNEYGAEGFRLESLETLPKDATTVDKRKRELFWMEHFSERGLLLNDSKISFQPPPGAQAKAVAQRIKNGYRPSQESNEKRRLAQLGKPKGHGAKISASKRGVKQKTAPCRKCGREVGISNLPRHERACTRKSSDEIVSSASK